MAKQVLIVFAHPVFEKSRANQALVRHIPKSEHLTFHDLYEHYPDYNIDLAHEQKLLLDHDILIWHHPFYWYSIPHLLKQWIDIVLAFKWAYGPGGTALEGKLALNAITSGGSREVYQHEGRNRFTVQEFLAPLEQTARLCQMTYLPPFAVQGTHRLTLEDLEDHGKQYGLLLQKFMDDDFDLEQIGRSKFLNDWLQTDKSNQP